MNTWLLIFLCGFITFFIRFIPLSGILNFKATKNYDNFINIIPIVVLTPIIFQAIFFTPNNEFSILFNAKLFAAIVGIFVSLFLNNVLYTIIIGMSVFWILNEIISNYLPI
jgi:branched-subunit amino acid transport protein|tara:strand:+ start:160 stop:492 length:333 start_codon:yes stop_codon:yes gene_type:complete